METKGFSNKLVTMEIHGVSDADVLGNNPIYENGSVMVEQRVVITVLD